jgi:hypothetical protein
MTQTNQNIDLYRGDSKVVVVALTNADNGLPFDPTTPGIDIQWRMACTMYGLDAPTAIDPPGPLLAKSLGHGIVGSPGQVEIFLTPTDTDREARQYRHALRVYDHGDVATTLTGTVLIRPVPRMGTLVRDIAAKQIKLSATVPSRVP